VCVTRSRIGRLAGLGDRHARLKFSHSRVRPRRPVPARGWWAASVGALLSHSPLEFAPAARGFGVRVNERGRVRARAACVSGPHNLATRFPRLEYRPWGLEPTIRRRERSIKPPHATAAATLLACAFAKRAPPVAASLLRSRAGGTLVPLARHSARRVARAPSRRRPAPFRVLGRAPHTTGAGRARLDLGGARFRSASRSTLAGPASSLEFCPSSNPWRVRAESALGLDALRTLRPYEPLHSGSTLRRRTPRPSWRLHTPRPPPASPALHERRLRSPVRRLRRPSGPSVAFVSVATRIRSALDPGGINRPARGRKCVLS